MAALSTFESRHPRAVRLLGQALLKGRLPHGILIAGGANTGADALGHALVARLACRAQNRPAEAGPPTPEPRASEGPNPWAYRAALDPCGTCAGCRDHAHGTGANVFVVAPDGRKGITIAQVRDVARKLALRAANGGLQVVQILSADTMAHPAQNALLKTLEEPPGPACFVLTVQRQSQLLPTIVSRVLRLVLTPPGHAESAAALARGGIDLPYAEWLAPWVGADHARAEAFMAEGLAQVAEDLHQALTLGLPAVEIQRLSVALGTDAGHFDLALVLLEIWLRDALAQVAAVPEGAMLQSGVRSMLSERPAEVLCLAVDRLVALRRSRHLPISRVQALEGLLTTLTRPGMLP